MADDSRNQQAKQRRVPVCGIGASAGGLEALQKLFGALPNDLGLAYVVIVHLAPDRKSDLPAIIGRWTQMPVTQVGDHDKATLEGNHVYVIAPDRRLEITDTSVGAANFEQVRGQRAAIDLFFRSLASARGDGFAVILSGSGSDGALGARAVKEGGGLVLVQDPQEAAHGDMPRAVIATGVADVVLPVKELVARLADLARTKESVNSVANAEESQRFDERGERALRGIFDLLRRRTGYDFSKYKRNTVLRRLARRMQLSHQLTIEDYRHFLRRDAGEVDALFDDLLISVTSFFRDPEAWDALQAQVIVPLLDRAAADEQLRVWVPACATGEEAYTLAILFHEVFERLGVQRDLVIFASDVDEPALAVAREGLYPRAIAADVAELRLDRYFRLEGDHYRVASTIRDHVVFAAHNLLRDPPFSRLHLVSCRNLLIYLDRELQEQAMAVFRYACRDEAFLFLGASEVADAEMFRDVDKKHRIFAIRPRTDGSRAPLPNVLATQTGPMVRREAQAPMRTNLAEIHLAALEEAAPPTVVIDERWNVLHLSPSASRFFQQSGGPLAQRITDLIRPELRDDLHALLHRAAEARGPQLSAFISVTFNGAPHRVAMLIQQPRNADGTAAHALITFLDAGEASEQPAPDQEPTSEMVRALREKLRQAEQRIENMRDDYYLTNEDLRAANEELQSLNEEYRSTTGELQTSKEELQSINEELQTVNQELKQKLEEVSRANSDLENLMAANDVATLFLDRQCRISRFTPRLGEIFNVKARDRERPISDITHVLDYAALESDARRMIAGSRPFQHEVRSRDGRVFVARLNPYRQIGKDEIDGVVITFIDVTKIKTAEAALRDSERRLEAELDVMRTLHRMTMAMATAPTLVQALNEGLTTAISLLGAQFGSVQVLDADSHKLKIIAQRGFQPEFLKTFDSIGTEDNSSCGRALRSHASVLIEDVASESDYTPYRATAAAAGYRAVQSEPMLGKDGKLVGVLSVHFREPHRFTDRERQIGALIAQQAADLIMAHRTAALEASEKELSTRAAQLVEYDRNKDRFLAGLGHELRNPMAAIQYSLERLLPSGEPSKTAIALIRRQAEHMVRLIDDLLDHTRINRGTLRIARSAVNLNQTVLAAVEAVRARARSKGLTAEAKLPDNPIFVHADQERLTQILDNLLNNALAFTEQGSITVSVERSEALARITVRDTGVGIDPARAETLFEPFSGADLAARGDGLGMGLGLSLVKRLVEMHEGTVALHSEGRGSGSEITFTIPLARGEIPPAPAPPDLPPPRRVLVVDDQRDVAEMFGRLLEGMGQDVRVAYSGEAALAVARAYRPHVAFVDLAMPGMDGEELARRLREEFAPEQLALVATSGYPRNEELDSAKLFEHHLLKPIAAEQLIALLNSLAPGMSSK